MEITNILPNPYDHQKIYIYLINSKCVCKNLIFWVFQKQKKNKLKPKLKKMFQLKDSLVIY